MFRLIKKLIYILLAAAVFLSGITSPEQDSAYASPVLTEGCISIPAAEKRMALILTRETGGQEIRARLPRSSEKLWKTSERGQNDILPAGGANALTAARDFRVNVSARSIWCIFLSLCIVIFLERSDGKKTRLSLRTFKVRMLREAGSAESALRRFVSLRCLTQA